MDLSAQPELSRHSAYTFQPHSTFQLRLLDSPIGPRMPWLGHATLRRRFSLPADLENSPPDLVLARVKPDPRMDPCLTGCDLAMLDLSLGWRTNIDPHGIYVISHAGESILRYVRPGKSCIYLAAADNFDSPIGWGVLPLDASGIETPVRARVIWIGLEEQLPLPAHQCGRFLVDATSS